MLFQIRAVVGATSLLALAAAAPLPTITSGQILRPSGDVSTPPGGPRLVLESQGSPGAIVFTWTGPSGEAFSQFFRGGPWGKKKVFQGTDALFPESTASKNVFGLYTQAGQWTLSQIFICSVSGCTTYDSAQLASLFNSPTITVTNPNKPDITPPVAQSAAITTPSVSIANAPDLLIDVSAADNLSGIYQIEVDASPPQSFGRVSASVFLDLSVYLKGTFHLAGTVQAGSPTGTYTVVQVSLRDVAGNLTAITDPAAISTLFNGAPSFQVTN